MSIKKIFESTVSVLILISFVGCNLTFSPDSKTKFNSSTVNSVVSRVIDEQMDYVKDKLDPEMQSKIDNGNAKGSGPLTGRQIVNLTLEEEMGEDYIDFCYNVEESTFTNSYDNVLDSSRDVLTDEKYNYVLSQTDIIEKSLKDWGDQQAKGIPEDQQEEFYQDLKVLVTRTVVLMTAGIVYCIMPDVVFWGKVSAAAAISVGAGLVALASMTLYEKYKFNSEAGPGDEGVENWVKELVKTPQADYALTTSVVTLATTMGQGAVVTGIMICVFGVLQAYDLINAMMKKYDFSL